MRTRCRLLAIGAMALIIGAGLCVFDLSDDDGTGLDLCSSAPALASGALALLVVAAGVRFAPALAERRCVTSFEPLPPPPRV